MTPDTPHPPGASSEEALDWTPDGRPVSRLYGDVYFSAQDGLAESRAVFLQGCGLPDAWRGRTRFVVGELGFGTGLNIAALLDLWSRERTAGGRLHVFSVEAHPISAADAARALAAWPELAPVTDLLTARWPGRAHGFHRVDLPELGATLDLFVGEVGEALSQWSGAADAWFLDGFSPALNPAMWSDDVLAMVAMRSAPGARAATFTVAGQVRRGLAAAGFDVAKQPGFGRKRERLEAVLPGAPAPASRRGDVAIVGGGVAGCAAARAVRALGGRASLIEAQARGAGASGNPAALVTPWLDAGLGAGARLHAQALRHARALYDRTPGAVLARGVRQLARTERDVGRFRRVAGSELFEPGEMAVDEVAMDQTGALMIDPRAVLEAWAGEILIAQVAAVERAGDRWRLMDPAGQVIMEADAVIVAASLGAPALSGVAPLQPVRGQLSWARSGGGPAPTAWGGYAAATPAGLMFGATHDRDDIGLEVRPADHQRNLATLAGAFPDLAAGLHGAALEGRAAIRAATRDHLPLAGETAPGLLVLSGLGGRGFTLAPLLADHVAALALGAPSPLSAEAVAILAPGRFGSAIPPGA